MNASNQKMRKEYEAIDKRKRADLLAFASRWALPLSECYDPSEVEAMSTSDIQRHVFLGVDLAPNFSEGEW